MVAMRGFVAAGLAAALGMTAGAGPARAGDGATEPPHLPVADLPPLPRGEVGDRVTDVVVAAGQEVEESSVIGAAKREQSLGTVASAVTVVAGDRLRRFGYRKLSEVLRAAAGVFVVDDRMSERVGFRGLQLLGDFNSRTLVLVDGLTVTEPWDQFSGIADDLPVAIDEVSRVEVIRGPVSSVYGTNAFFGIVNIITRPADQLPRAWGRVTGGSFGTAQAAAGFAAGSVDREIRGTVSGIYRAGETLDYPEFAASGADPRTDADGMDAYQAGVAMRYHGAFAQFRAVRRLRELPGSPYDTAIGDHRNHNIDRLGVAEAGYTRTIDRLTTTVRGYMNDYRFTDYLVYEPDPNFRDYGDSFWWGGEARGRYELLDRGRLGLTAGIEGSRDKTRSRSYEIGFREDGTVVAKNFTAQGVYGELDGTPLDFLGFAAGLRFDRNSRFRTHLSPRAALFVDHDDRIGLKLLYADGFRYPSPFEAFFEDGIDFIANRDLGPERIRSYEVVAWAAPRPALLLRASAFRWNLRDLIEQEEVLDPVSMESRLQFQNIAQMTSTGVELEGSMRTTDGWLVYGNASLQKVERQRGAEVAANAPWGVAAAGVATPLLAGRLQLSTEAQALSSRHTRDPDRDARAWLGWNAVAYLPDVHGVDLTVGVRNLLGVREQVVAQEDYDRTDGISGDGTNPIYTLPGEGREFYARAGYRY